MGLTPSYAEGVIYGRMDFRAATIACQRAMAAYPGEARFMAYAGLAAARQGHNTEAIDLYRRAAEQDNAVAQVYLGEMYEKGDRDLGQNDIEAVRLYRLAADQGSAWGQDSLGRMYEQGRGGLAQDEREAVRLYRLAGLWCMDPPVALEPYLA